MYTYVFNSDVSCICAYLCICMYDMYIRNNMCVRERIVYILCTYACSRVHFAKTKIHIRSSTRNICLSMVPGAETNQNPSDN